MILVPRPAPHLPRTLMVLEAAGLTNLLPLALSRPQSVPARIPATAAALLITSPLGLQKGLPSLPAYCVGPASAAAARQAGLRIAYTGSNNGTTMAQDLVGQNLPPTHFAHLHGDHAGMAWHALLKLAGHDVTPVPAYKTRRITKLPASFKASPAYTLLFSAGSATHLANLLKQVNIKPTGTAVCLSPAVASAAALHWPRVVTSDAPTLEALAATLRRLPR